MPTPKYKVRPDTGELQEYLFEYNGILALKNFVARVDGERLILHSAEDMNFSILDALVSEVEINGVVYDNADAAQQALQRLTFNTNRPVIMTQHERELLLGALQSSNYVGTAADLKSLIDGKVDKETGKGLSTNDFTNAYKQKLDTLEDYDIELDENTTELRFKKGSNVVKRISLMFLDDEGTKLVYNKPDKTLELRDKRNNLLTSIPVSHFVSNIPDGIVVQNGKIKLMAGNNVIFENAFSYNDLADKPDLNFAPASHRHNWDDIDGKPDYLPTTGGTVNGDITANSIIKKNSSNDKVLLGGGGEKSLSELDNKNILVGGRNLLRETADFVLRDLPYYLQSNYAGNGGYANDTFMGNKVIKLVNNWQGFQCKTTFEDLPMVISFWAKTTKPNIKFKGIADVNVEFVNGNDLIPDGNWHKYIIRKNSRIITSNGSNQGFVEFYYEDQSKHIEEVYISSFKIEYGNTSTDWSPNPEDLKTHNLYDTITDAHNFLKRDGDLHFGSGSNIANAPSLSYYEMFGFTHSNKNWGFIVAKNIDEDDKCLYVKQIINGSYKDWFKIKENDPVGNIINGTRQILPNEADKVIFITNSIDNCALNVLSNKCSVSFRKVFDGGYVNFTCLGKNIIYTGDNQFNGKKGSTAVVSIYENDCYIDIRNI